MTAARKAPIALAITAVLVLVAGVAPAAAAPVPSAGKSLRGLVRQTAKVPAAQVGKAKRARLLRIARHARRRAAKAPCVSSRDLVKYRRALRRTKPKRSVKGAKRRRALNRLAGLDASSTAATRSLLKSPKTKRCGGGVAPSTLEETKATVLKSDLTGLSVRVELPQLQFVPEAEGNRVFTRLAAPGTETPTTPGSPGIPVSSHVLGIPDGAQLTVTTSNAKSQTIPGVEVYPAQPDTVDQAQGQTPKPDFFAGPFASPPFTLDKQAYADKGETDGPAATPLGQARDLTIAGLRVPLAQYDPDSDALEVFTSIDVTVDFEGGAGAFPPTTRSPWEKAQQRLASGLLNAGTVLGPIGQYTPQPCGEELLVVTNPSTRTLADFYADARRAAGFLTRVRETGSGVGQLGTTATEIRDSIRARVNSLNCIRPSYVTIMGDDELVPTFASNALGIPTDNPYSTKNDADELPDLAVGRILAQDNAQLGAALAKIIGYETTPPTGPMLTRAAIAAQFEDPDSDGGPADGTEDRTFIRFAERAREGLIDRGNTVDRIYDDDPSSNPKKFWDGTDLPASLKKPTFAWNGDAGDITAAWNQGRFLFVHRDHGWSDGWGSPEYTTEDVDALSNTNENLPVLMSINCASAQYDTDETSFVQNALVKSTGGAVGVFGDTRNSPSWHNSEMTLGFIDALLPSVLGGEGPSTKQRVGDALVHGKLRLVGLAPPNGPGGVVGGDADTREELYLWHYFGDPTMQMFGGGTAPLVFNPNQFKAIYKGFMPPKPGDPPPYEVEVQLPPGLGGQPFSLLRNGEVIGKALAGDGSVKIPALFNDGPPQPGELKVALDADDAAPVQIPVDGVPPSPALTQRCPESVPFDTQGTTTVQVDGTLTGAPAGATVEVTFTKPTRNVGGVPVTPTETVQASVNGQGAWTASVETTNRQDIGEWKVSSTYGSETEGPCTIEVFLP